ncbi:MAG: hypothetical protein AB7U41_07420 [Dongiaceae bacterium]
MSEHILDHRSPCFRARWNYRGRPVPFLEVMANEPDLAEALKHANPSLREKSPPPVWHIRREGAENNFLCGPEEMRAYRRFPNIARLFFRPVYIVRLIKCGAVIFENQGKETALPLKEGLHAIDTAGCPFALSEDDLADYYLCDPNSGERWRGRIDRFKLPRPLEIAIGEMDLVTQRIR